MVRKKRKNNISNKNNLRTRMATQEQKELISDYVKKSAMSLEQSIREAQMLNNISAHNGVYQPILSEQLLQQVNFNPKSATSDDIETWLLNPQYNDIKLRALSQYLEYAVGQYQRALHYFSDMLSFNYMILPDNKNNKKLLEKDEKKYLESYYRVCNKVSKMNPKNTFNGIGLTIMQDGVSFWLKVDSADHTGFLPIPTDYCRIVSKWGLGWKGEVNLVFFDKMYALKQCLPEITEAYELFIQKREEGLMGEDLAPFQYFPLPVEKTWIFNFDQNKAVKVPPLASSMGSSLDVLAYKKLLKDQSIIDLWKVISLKIPMKPNGNELIMTYQEASEIVALIQSTLPDNMNVFASPFEPDQINTNQITSLDKTIDMSNNSFYTSLGSSGAFFGMESKSAKGLDINQKKDFLFSATPIYAQFNNMVNWFINLDEDEYKWKVNFFGNEIAHNEEINNALKLTTTANFPMSYLASCVGFEPAQFEGMVDLENAIGLKEKLHPIVSAYQQSSKVGGNDETTKSEKSEVGDKKPLEELSDEGIATRDTRGEI